MKALVLNCSLKATPEQSNTEALAGVLVEELVSNRVETAVVRGPSYLESDEKREWSETTGRTAAGVLLAVAKALQANPLPPDAYRA